jgi:hypothetical protein
MPSRILRDGIIDSRAIACLSIGAELFYRCLMSIVDDYGRYEADPELLRVKCFPRRLTEIDGQMTVRWLSEVSQTLLDDGHPLVTVYQCENGKKYLQINNFKQRVRAEHSKCPSPDGHMTVICRSDDGPLPASRAQPRVVVECGVVVDSRASESGELPPLKLPEGENQSSEVPGNRIAWMRDSLIGYMGGPEARQVQVWGLPDDELCRQCLDAGGEASLPLIGQTLRELHKSKGLPSQSWGWFPPMIAKLLHPARPGLAKVVTMSGGAA